MKYQYVLKNSKESRDFADLCVKQGTVVDWELRMPAPDRPAVVLLVKGSPFKYLIEKWKLRKTTPVLKSWEQYNIVFKNKEDK